MSDNGGMWIFYLFATLLIFQLEWSTHHDSQDVDFERTTPPRDFIEDE